MDKRDQSKKDEIILRQLEVIRSMTEHNLSRMGTGLCHACHGLRSLHRPVC